MATQTPITTDELRAAFDRAPYIRFRGWTFERCLGVPMMRICLEHSARAHRAPNQPQQPRLI